MLRKDVKSQLFSTGMLISLLLGLVLLIEPQYQYFLYFARWDNKADYINFFFKKIWLKMLNFNRCFLRRSILEY